MQNGVIESFQGRMRGELLHETAFSSMVRARAVIAAWMADNNTARPHSALGYQTPAVHAAKLKAMGAGSPPFSGSKPVPIAQTCMGRPRSAGKPLFSLGRIWLFLHRSRYPSARPTA